MKNKLLSDSIVYIISPIILLAFTNYSTIIYFTSALVFILSIYTIITKKRESRINVSGIIFSTTYILMFLFRQKVQKGFDMYIYDTCLMIVLTLIIVLPLLLNKNIFRQIYIDIRKCRRCCLIANSHFLRTAGPHSPDSPGHIKRTVLEISRAERGLRPANQYQALSQKAMPSQSVR